MILYDFAGNVTVGGVCDSRERCIGTPDSVYCNNNGICVCRTSYIEINRNCVKGMNSNFYCCYVSFIFSCKKRFTGYYKLNNTPLT